MRNASTTAIKPLHAWLNMSGAADDRRLSRHVIVIYSR